MYENDRKKHHYDTNKTYNLLSIKLVIIRKPEQQHEDVVQYETNIPSSASELKAPLEEVVRAQVTSRNSNLITDIVVDKLTETPVCLFMPTYSKYYVPCSVCHSV
jgi:hypothetical protein